MKKTFITIITVVLCMLSACQYGSFDKQTEGAKDSDSTAIHIAVLPIMECNPFVTAQECGLFDSLGIAVKLDTFAAAMDADTAFMNGKADLLVADILKEKYLNSIIKDDSIRSLATDTLRLSLLTTRQSRINGIKSLKDKIVALTRNSSLDDLANKVMIKANLKPEELNRPQINNLELRTYMLSQNQYDGAILPEPYATQCENFGAKRIYTSNELQFVVLVKNKFYKKNKHVVNQIINAYNKVKDKSILAAKADLANMKAIAVEEEATEIASERKAENRKATDINPKNSKSKGIKTSNSTPKPRKKRAGKHLKI